MSDIVEQYTIRPIPGSARHGSARDLLPFWFTVNASVYTIGLGVFAAEFRLGLWPTIAAIVAGAAVGGAFMAAHSAQGPRLGVPQLVQSHSTDLYSRNTGLTRRGCPVKGGHWRHRMVR